MGVIHPKAARGKPGVSNAGELAIAMVPHGEERRGGKLLRERVIIPGTCQKHDGSGSQDFDFAGE